MNRMDILPVAHNDNHMVAPMDINWKQGVFIAVYSPFMMVNILHIFWVPFLMSVPL